MSSVTETALVPDYSVVGFETPAAPTARVSTPVADLSAAMSTPATRMRTNTPETAADLSVALPAVLPAVAAATARTVDFSAARVRSIAAPSFFGLNLQACVEAGYDQDENQIFFTVPIFGQIVSIESPIEIPLDAVIKACIKTCGSAFGFLPGGVSATIYVNDGSVWSGTVLGDC